LHLVFLSVLILSFFMQPREALLKYAEAATNDPQWTAGEIHDFFFQGANGHSRALVENF
jgi:hypothetical protein